MLKHKAGDLVTIRSDLAVGTRYDKFVFVADMKEKLGEVVEIKSIDDNCYTLVNSRHYWTDEMFMDYKQSLIAKLIEIELQEAKTKHGDTFHSDHEAYAVLKEEIEECDEESTEMFRHLSKMWKIILCDDSVKESVELIHLTAKYMIIEAAQVAAVCEKYLGGK